MALPTTLNEHFTGTTKHKKAKKAFMTREDAWDFIKTNNIKDKSAYKCCICGMYHIGGRHNK